ncbi:phage portal protein [Leucothrix sargassi]|nr:phage portal protein [Leucothrix sargassi]
MTTKNKEQDAELPVNAGSFGKADSALADNPYLEHFSTTILGEEGEDYYEPPISFSGLAKLLRVNPQHSRLPSLVANWVVKRMKLNDLISRESVRRVVMEYCAMGNAVVELERNRRKEVISASHRPVINIRKLRRKKEQFGELTDGKITPLKIGSIVHIKEYDLMQSVYGVPFWIGALQSILLGEDIRLFPRRFFGNGAHAKQAVITTGLGSNDRKAVDSQISETRNNGQFKTIVLHMGKGKADDLIKFIDFAENASKIEYGKLSSMTATDVLEAWGVPPELAGQMPDGPGSSRDLDKIERVFDSTIIVPIQQLVAETINPFLPPIHQLAFDDFEMSEELADSE